MTLETLRIEQPTQTKPIEWINRLDEPDISHIVTEDDEPVDNIPSEKQQRFLAESLYTSWTGGAEKRMFLASTNVGLFRDPHEPPIVPDVFLSMDVEVAEDWYAKKHRTYFFWEFGKPPEVVIEVVPNRKGGEDTSKLDRYAQMGVEYYVIFDPLEQLSKTVLRVYRLHGQSYRGVHSTWFESVGLGVCLWEGEYEGMERLWLRWCDRDGRLIPTGAERVAWEQQRADREAAARTAAESEIARLRAEIERLRSSRR